jgi:CheY-like chemotaxis protein
MTSGNVGPQKTMRPRDVLIVEDNVDARETLKRLLEYEGHRVRVAVDGPSALEAMREAPAEVALIDIGLPKMDGYELARRIRTEADGGGALLVAVTGYGTPEDRSRSAAAGFDVHLVKPVNPDELTKVLATEAKG